MNNKTKISLAILSAVVLPLQLMAVDLGVAGSISGWNQSDSGASSGVNDLRLKLSDSIGNSSKLNVVADITSGLSIKEGYLTFAKPLSILGLGHDLNGLEVVAGQKLLSFGRDNGRYTEDRAFVGRSMAVSGLLGDGLVGKGAEATYTLPVALPVKVSAGFALDTVVGGTTTRTKAKTVRAVLIQDSYSVGASALMKAKTPSTYGAKSICLLEDVIPCNIPVYASRIPERRLLINSILSSSSSSEVGAATEAVFAAWCINCMVSAR
jgi:hypothetical protein